MDGVDAVDDCEILVIHEISTGIAGIIHYWMTFLVWLLIDFAEGMSHFD